MTPVEINPDSRGYTYAAIMGFLNNAWEARKIPERGHLRRNGQLVQLIYPGHSENYRLLIYKVGGSGRGRMTERRIEITSTYVGGRLQPEEGVEDVLLGYDPEKEVFVGFDSRRLHHGGTTENASAFIDVEGLRLAAGGQIVVLPRSSELFKLEYHAFFKARRLAEYIVNRSSIHVGAYSGGGLLSGDYSNRQEVASVQLDGSASIGTMVVLEAPVDAALREPSKRDLESMETGRTERFRSRKVTPEQMELVLQAAARNGALGEFVVMEYERKRLLHAGRGDLARMVRWTSKENVAAGFDIASYEVNGTPRFIEVKAGSSKSKRFIITRNEWLTAQEQGPQYWIYLVTDVRNEARVTILQNPVDLEIQGRLARTASEWVVRVK